MDRLAKSDPDNARLQRDLAASYGRIGNVQVDQCRGSRSSSRTMPNKTFLRT
jgi:hypothetical protein